MEKLNFAFVVVGGGMAGLCAAVAASRNGIKTAIIQDRPMFGGNASSEIRMWICGAHGVKESGLLEELQLDNYYFNPNLKYSIWDDVMHSFAKQEKNLTIFLNSTVHKVDTVDNSIIAVEVWQLNSYKRFKIFGSLFADCSGDSILKLSGAKYRSGRESKIEFNEPHAPDIADQKTMGNSILLQLRRTDNHQNFRAPSWAYHYTDENCPKRDMMPTGHNFWWLEFGGVKDTIKDSDAIRDELLKIAYGVWEYIKNHPDKRAANWELDWIGSLPGKRENIRYIGEHVLSQSEIEAGGKFSDIVAYGGWTMDDHHPEAIYYKGDPNIFHPAPSPYGIPYRSLYSKNIHNLFFAGRNISATHMAMSSTRVMATCAMMGQAIGTAAAIAYKNNCSPRAIYQNETSLSFLQKTLMDQDQFLPHLKRAIPDLTMRAKTDFELLRNGFDRDFGGNINGITLVNGKSCTYQFDKVETISGCRIIFDSDFDDVKRMLCSYGLDKPRQMPQLMARDLTLEIYDNGAWVTILKISDNHHRYLELNWNSVRSSQVRLTVQKSWGNHEFRIYSFEVR